MFLQIERPGEHDGLPEDDEFETIGQFYEAIEEALQRLSAELGEEALFSGDPARQVTDALYYGGSGRIIAVTDLASALRRARGDRRAGRGAGRTRRSGTATATCSTPSARRSRTTSASTSSTSAAATGRATRRSRARPARQFTVDWDAVHNMRPNPRSSDYPEGSPIRAQLDEFNHAYSGRPPPAARVLQRQPAAAGRRDRPDVRAEGRGRQADGAAVGRRRDHRRAELRVRAAGASATSRAASSRRSWSSRTGPTSSTATCRSRARGRSSRRQDDSIAWRKTEVLETEDTYALCRCGQSGSKPFCDGTHARVDFDGTEEADTRLDDRADPDRPRARSPRRRARPCSRAPASSSSATATCACTRRSASAALQADPGDDGGRRRQRRPRADHRADRALPVGLVHVLAHARRARTSRPTYPVGIAVTAGGALARGQPLGHRRHPARSGRTGSRSRRGTA